MKLSTMTRRDLLRAAGAATLVAACAPAAQTGASAKPAGPTGTLTFLWGGDTDKLDPPAMTSQEGFIRTAALYESLVRYKPNSTDVEPALAERWDVASAGLAYTFHLRSGVKFHDGTPLTAEAVAFTFDRCINKDNPLFKEAQTAGGFPYIDDYIGNVVAKVEATGPLDVRFTLRRKFSPLLSNLAIPPAYVISMDALKKYGSKINENPVGTGPFKFTEWKKDDHITVENFDGYWGQRAKLQKVIFQPVPEASVRALKIQRGEADIAWPFDPKDAPSLKGKADTDVLEQAGVNVNMAEFNLKKPQFQNKSLRQALNYAINKQELAEKLYSGAGLAAVGALPPTSWGFDSGLKGYPYDPDKAKALLKDPGYRADTNIPDSTTIPRGYNPQGGKIAEAIQHDFHAVGVKSEIKTTEWTEYRKIQRQGALNIAFGGWQADTGDPENFLGVFFYSKNQGGVNTSFYGTPEVDKLLEQANEETDVPKRKALFNQAERKIVDDAPWLFISHMKQQVAIRKRVQGFVLQPTYIYYFNNVSVS